MLADKAANGVRLVQFETRGTRPMRHPSAAETQIKDSPVNLSHWPGLCRLMGWSFGAWLVLMVLPLLGIVFLPESDSPRYAVALLVGRCCSFGLLASYAGAVGLILGAGSQRPIGNLLIAICGGMTLALLCGLAVVSVTHAGMSRSSLAQGFLTGLEVGMPYVMCQVLAAIGLILVSFGCWRVWSAIVERRVGRDPTGGHSVGSLSMRLGVGVAAVCMPLCLFQWLIFGSGFAEFSGIEEFGLLWLGALCVGMASRLILGQSKGLGFRVNLATSIVGQGMLAAGLAFVSAGYLYPTLRWFMSVEEMGLAGLLCWACLVIPSTAGLLFWRRQGNRWRACESSEEAVNVFQNFAALRKLLFAYGACGLGFLLLPQVLLVVLKLWLPVMPVGDHYVAAQVGGVGWMAGLLGLAGMWIAVARHRPWLFLQGAVAVVAVLFSLGCWLAGPVVYLISGRTDSLEWLSGYLFLLAVVMSTLVMGVGVIFGCGMLLANWFRRELIQLESCPMRDENPRQPGMRLVWAGCWICLPLVLNHLVQFLLPGLKFGFFGILITVYGAAMVAVVIVFPTAFVVLGRRGNMPGWLLPGLAAVGWAACLAANYVASLSVTGFGWPELFIMSSSSWGGAVLPLLLFLLWTHESGLRLSKTNPLYPQLRRAEAAVIDPLA